MAIGAFKVEAPAGYTDYTSYQSATTNKSMAERITFDKTVIIRSVWVYYAGIGTASTPLWVFRVFKVSDGTAADTGGENLWGSSSWANGWYEIQLNTPVTLQANVQYSVGFQVPGTYNTYLAYDGTTSASNLVGLVTPSSGGPGVQWWGQAYYNSNDAVSNGSMPTSTTTSNLLIKLSVDVWTPPTATNITPKYGDNSAPVRLNWTYTSAMSAAQTNAEISYRVSGSTGAYTTLTSGSANPYYDVPAGNFTSGTEYELRVRVNDGTTWGDYTTITFTGGAAPWTYGAQVTSSTSSGPVPDTVYTTGFETGITDWESNGVFGYYTAATLAQDATIFDTGTKSLKVTWPAASNSWANTHLVNGVTNGQLYLVTARVRVPAGMPAVEFDVAFSDYYGDTSTLFDQWQTIQCVFLAAADNNTFVGIRNKQGTTPTAGQYFNIDNFTVTQAELVGGTYELQVRTSDGYGFGAWSATTNFVVNTPPAAAVTDVSPKNVGGNVNVYWNKTDVNSDAQTKYKIRYRKRS